MNITHFVIDNNQHSLTINFSASKVIANTELSFEYLRISSPANLAKKLKPGQIAITSHKKAVLLVNIESVAKHGYRLIFDDDHSAIYSEEYLQRLSVEYKERWQQYLAELKSSGHSREAMIDIKQL
ncbi:MAG: gamma-butyrobetaine hydroxylase-like domain-containing protein [Colwellia sp.]|nr:gamma-butyrobetaine hydroxylase-like domain-containing protein [Colwellia sp.]